LNETAKSFGNHSGGQPKNLLYNGIISGDFETPDLLVMVVLQNQKTMKKIISARTRKLFLFDMIRWRTRFFGRSNDLAPSFPQLHLGCGARKIPGWLNVDVIGSDHDLDLATGTLPWKDDCFKKVVSQHVVEHLDLFSELIPLLKELHRVCQTGATVYLSCPDMAKVCRAYLTDKGAHLLQGRKRRFPAFLMDDVPVQHIINDIFYQSGEHQNLFDAELLGFAVQKGGFSHWEEITAEAFMADCPEFPDRDDAEVTLYLKAVK
jgi:predicted SAM-dependent methyltransferase